MVVIASGGMGLFFLRFAIFPWRGSWVGTTRLVCSCGSGMGWRHVPGVNGHRKPSWASMHACIARGWELANPDRGFLPRPTSVSIMISFFFFGKLCSFVQFSTLFLCLSMLLIHVCISLV